MQSVVAVMGWPEIIGVLTRAVILVVILGANEIVERLKGTRHGLNEFKQAIPEIQRDVTEASETKTTKHERATIRLHPFIFWLFVALVIAMLAVALGLL